MSHNTYFYFFNIIISGLFNFRTFHAVEAGADPRAGSALTTAGMMAWSKMIISRERDSIVFFESIKQRLEAQYNELREQITALGDEDTMGTQTRVHLMNLRKRIAPIEVQIKEINSPKFIAIYREQLRKSIITSETASEIHKLSSPLHGAAKCGYVKLMKAMLETGADPHALALRDINILDRVVAVPAQTVINIAKSGDYMLLGSLPKLPKEIGFALLFNPQYYNLTGFDYAQSVMDAAAEHAQTICVLELIKYGIPLTPKSALNLMRETSRLCHSKPELRKLAEVVKFTETLIDIVSNSPDVSTDIYRPHSGAGASGWVSERPEVMATILEGELIISDSMLVAAKSLVNILSKSSKLADDLGEDSLRLNEIPPIKFKLARLPKEIITLFEKISPQEESEILSEEIRSEFIEFIKGISYPEWVSEVYESEAHFSHHPSFETLTALLTGEVGIT